VKQRRSHTQESEREIVMKMSQLEAVDGLDVEHAVESRTHQRTPFSTWRMEMMESDVVTVGLVKHVHWAASSMLQCGMIVICSVRKIDDHADERILKDWSIALFRDWETCGPTLSVSAMNLMALYGHDYD